MQKSATVNWPCAILDTYEYEVAILDWRMPTRSVDPEVVLSGCGGGTRLSPS